MGTNLGDIPQEYLDGEKKAQEQARQIDTQSINKKPDSREVQDSMNLTKDITLPNFKSISPSSFFELKREFLSLSESYIARFTEKLNAKKDLYENNESERKARDLFASKKLGNSI